MPATSWHPLAFGTVRATIRVTNARRCELVDRPWVSGRSAHSPDYSKNAPPIAGRVGMETPYVECEAQQQNHESVLDTMCNVLTTKRNLPATRLESTLQHGLLPRSFFGVDTCSRSRSISFKQNPKTNRSTSLFTYCNNNQPDVVSCRYGLVVEFCMSR